VARQTLDRKVEVVFDPRGLARLEGRLEADIRIVTLPAGYDPDKLIREDAGAWAKLLEQARPVVEFIIDSMVAEVDMSDAKSKSAAVNRALPILSDVSNPVERDHYTQLLARKLQIDERTLASMAGRSAVQPTRPNRRRTRTQPAPPPAWDAENKENQTPAAPDTPRLPPPPPQELYCLHQILTLPAVRREADTCLLSLEMPPISSTDFSDAQNRAIFVHLERLGTPEDLQEQIDDALLPRLESIHTQLPPAENISTEKLATHLAYTILLLRKESAELDKKALDNAYAEDLINGRIGEYSQQVLELRKRLQVVSRALELINNPKLTPASKAA
jgi:DNA primase